MTGIRACIAIGNGPMNCQLANHDTPVGEAIDLTIALMEAGEKLGARIHLEVHHDTCTETPEKTAAIIAGYRERTGQHLQIPITDGKGNFSPEYEDVRPFIRQALQHWLDGPRPENEFWVMPEQGCTHGYPLSCFPNIWQDAVVLAKDIRAIWNELTG